MNALSKRLTYANVMSTIAVFLVLGGATAVAATQLGKNSVGAKQLKKNAVTAKKIKSNAVTGPKIKKGAITGAKINLSSLGTVPSAQSAATASSAGTAANLNGFQRKLIRVAATPAASYEAGIAAAPETAVFTAGPLTVYGKCFVYSNTVYGMLLIKTSAPGAIFDSYYDNLEGHPYLNPGTTESNRELYVTSASGNYSTFAGDGYYGLSAIAADGTALTGKYEVGVKQGTLAEGDGPWGAGDGCLFGGQMTQQNL